MAIHYFGIKNKLVRDSLDSIDFLENNDFFIAGGLVPQLYGKGREDIYRKTLDVDLITPNKVSFQSFKDKSFSSEQKLRLRKYQVQFKKGRGNYSIKIMTSQNKPDSKTFFINLDYLSSNIYEFFNDYIENQLSNSKEISFESNILRVESLEELIPMKANRLINKSKESDFSIAGGRKFLDRILNSHFSDLALIDLKELKNAIRFYQNSNSNGRFSQSNFDKYKVVKDLFDISASCRLIADNQYIFNNEKYKKNLKRVLNPTL